MYSKRVRLLVRIIGFLFCTIGLLFISIKVLNMTNEGFQTDSEFKECPRYNTRDKVFYLCNEDDDAQSQVRILFSTNDIFSGVCYKTFEGYYSCYTRPSQKSYVENMGIFVNKDPSEDYGPSVIESSVMNVCEDYGITYNKLNTIYISTVSIGGVIQSSISTLKGATVQLGAISIMYCRETITDPKLINICKTLSSGIGSFDGLPSGLAIMSTTVSTSIGDMNNISSTLYRTYDGFGFSTCAVNGFPGYKMLKHQTF
jgi:hypothetical protein